jgi:hypothetical protein
MGRKEFASDSYTVGDIYWVFALIGFREADIHGFKIWVIDRVLQRLLDGRSQRLLQRNE